MFLPFCVELGGGLARKIGDGGLGLAVGLRLAEGLGLAGGLGFKGEVGGPGGSGGGGGGGKSHGGLGRAGDVDGGLGLAGDVDGGVRLAVGVLARGLSEILSLFVFVLFSKLEISDVYESENYESNQVKLN